MSVSGAPAQAALPTLASQRLPKRARQLLEGIRDLVSQELKQVLIVSLDEFERELFRLADQSKIDLLQANSLDAQRMVMDTRYHLVPRFLRSLEAELAVLRSPTQSQVASKSSGDGGIGIGTDLELVSELDVDEVTIVAEISNRIEMGTNMPLYLLGQRFAVLAGAPGLGSESIPIGPQALCRMVRDASDCLGVSPAFRLLFFKSFEKQLMMIYGRLIDSVNNYLAQNTILPNIQYMPTRPRKATPPQAAKAQSDSARRSERESNNQDFALPWEEPAAQEAADLPLRVAGRRNVSRAPVSGQHHPAPPQGADASPETEIAPGPGPGISGSRGLGTARTAVGGSGGSTAGGMGESEAESSFKQMRELLASRNQLLSKLKPGALANATHGEPVSSNQLQETLRALQGRIATASAPADASPAIDMRNIKQELLAHLQVNSPGQDTAALNDEDNDTVDLVGMLFEQIKKDIKPDGLAAQSLDKLQVPLLRIALQDKSFFTKQDHPARQMLQVIAESGAYWLGQDDETDPALLSRMNTVVDRTVNEFDGDLSLLRQLLADLNTHLNLLSHKADVAERRHVEAARGQERLALAREQASTAVSALLTERSPPRFAHALLSQAWTDVMALTALRQGEGSAVWKQQLEVAGQLIQVAKAPPGKSPISADDAKKLKRELEGSLAQVGYQADEAAAIAHQLIDPQEGKQSDGSSRTELTLGLKSRTRFGVDAKAAKPSGAPLTAEERARHEQLKLVAFGTWFDFVSNQQGDRIRRRLAWFSTVTDNSLFVNQRGQKVGEYRLQALARKMVAGELQIVEEKPSGIIDRAWQSVMTTLKSFSGQAAPGSPAR